MKTPPFFLGSALMFWGYQTGLVWPAVAAALVLEWAGFFPGRFEFKADDFNKFVDMAVILVAAVVVTGLVKDARQALALVFRWLPMLLLPVAAAQQFSSLARIHVSAFYFLSRKKRDTSRRNKGPEINISPLFALACLISAGSESAPDPLFSPITPFLPALFFAGWLLWYHRPRRYPLPVFILVIVLAAVGGHQLHTGMHTARQEITRWMMRYYDQHYLANPFRSNTALGAIGELKLSNAIVLRIMPGPDLPVAPFRLRQAGYTLFSGTHWFARAAFRPVSRYLDLTLPEALQDDNWLFNPLPNDRHPRLKTLVIYSRSNRKMAVLPCPDGTVQIAELEAGQCGINPLQTIRASGVRGFVKTRVYHTGRPDFDAEPGPGDRFIPKAHRNWTRRLAVQLKLHRSAPEDRIRLTRQFYARNFTYTLNLDGKGGYQTSLENFVFNTRAGHCEFFATATVLLLRQAGIPARYITGFMVHEKDPVTGHFIAREQDGHAWARAYVRGQWIDVDTTPPSFMQQDRQAVSRSRLADWLALIEFSLFRFQHETARQLLADHGLWLLVPLGIILFFRLKRKSGIRSLKTGADRSQNGPETEQDRTFLMLEQFLSRKGLGRKPHETLKSWADRIDSGLPSSTSKKALAHALEHHGNRRYGPDRTLGPLPDRLVKKIQASFDD